LASWYAGPVPAGSPQLPTAGLQARELLGLAQEALERRQIINTHLTVAILLANSRRRAARLRLQVDLPRISIDLVAIEQHPARVCAGVLAVVVEHHANRTRQVRIVGGHQYMQVAGAIAQASPRTDTVRSDPHEQRVAHRRLVVRRVAQRLDVKLQQASQTPD